MYMGHIGRSPALVATPASTFTTVVAILLDVACSQLGVKLHTIAVVWYS